MCNLEKRAKEQLLSRRQALKTLLATGGAGVLSSLPDKWQTPVVEVGALPAFAQISPILTISSLTRSLVGLNDCSIPIFGTGSSFTIRFSYHDPTGNVTLAAKILYTSNNAGIPSTISLADSFVTITGNALQGTIEMNLCTRFGADLAVTETIRLRNAIGIESNSLTNTTPRPVGAQQEGRSSPSRQSLWQPQR